MYSGSLKLNQLLLKYTNPMLSASYDEMVSDLEGLFSSDLSILKDPFAGKWKSPMKHMKEKFLIEMLLSMQHLTK